MGKFPGPKKEVPSVFFRAVAIFLLIIILMELVARISWVQKDFPYRSLGNFNYQFEIKWFGLEKFVEQNGGVDVIVLGSSLANTGIDPNVMAQVFLSITGRQIRIFNFGVEGLTISPLSAIAKILVNKYHPALLIYVTSMPDYIADNGLEYEQIFLSDPWIQYQQGNLNIHGWLVENSQGLEYYLPYRDWMQTSFPQYFYKYVTRSQNTSASGYEPEFATEVNIESPPDPNATEEFQYFEIYGNYQIAPSRLKNLDSLLSLGQDKETNVLIIEMPFYPTFYVYVGGEDVHKQFQLTISAEALKAGSSFIPAETCKDIPLAGRANRWHLNYIGAPVFSSCLGQQLAVLANEQNNYFIKSKVVYPSSK
jgi:hypothetical protein